MCGIAGILDFKGRPVDTGALVRMIRVQRHRGPDDEGVYVGDSVGLGHCRLAILDLSGAGRQPIGNEDGSVQLVCNGEIYNYVELRETLLRRGHRFKTRTDVEVIVHLYEELGEACVERLRGMFALALWDGQARRLLLARDRAGQKPLVYGVQDGRLVFASEVKGLLASYQIDATLDPQAVDLVFTYGFTPWPHTMFREIRKLAPATVLIAEGGGMRQHRYWRPRLVPKQRVRTKEAAERFLALLRDASRLQSVGDVPSGILLSGGLDSTTVAALMAEQTGRVRTFTVGFAGATDPDLESARAVARTLGAAHEEVLVDARMIDVLPSAVWHYEEPYTNPVILPHYELCRRLKRSVTVVHGAEGADELLAGYSGYSRWKWFERIHRICTAAGAGCVAGRLARVLPATTSPGRLARLLAASPAELRGVKRMLDALPARRMYSPDLAAAVSAEASRGILDGFYAAVGPGPFLDRLLMMDLLLHNAHGVTAFSDSLGMAHSVEVRSIFLDHHVIDFVGLLPTHLKLRGVNGRKFILREAVRNVVPAHVLQRRKVGYGEGIPFARLFASEWSGYARDVVLGGLLGKTGFFSPSAIEVAWNEHAEGKHDHFALLWALLCFGVWYEVYRAEFVRP